MKNAFTLIELLVVIAIIAILAAILFPVFAQAKVAAKATVILSNQKQQVLGVIMYMGDTDDTMPSWITRTELVHDPVARYDIVSWVQQVQPYIKNGNPTLPAGWTSSTNNVPPQGIFYNSEWTAQKWVAAADQPDCDGAGQLDAWAPVVWAHAYYGLAFGANNVGVCPAQFGDKDPNGGLSQSDPVFYFAGSATPYHTAATVQNNLSQNVSAVQRPAETALISDGFTGVINGGGFGTTMGCESATMYKGGGNLGFVEGHVKFVKGNSQRYLAQDSANLWYEKYYTMDR